MILLIGIVGILAYLAIGGITLGAISYDDEDTDEAVYELESCDALIILGWPVVLTLLGILYLATWSRKKVRSIIASYRDQEED